MAEILEQFRITDFLDWHRQKALEINRDFQRRSVWTPAARSYLIDTILRKFPIPKIYLRTKIDVLTKHSVREVVDGQQRILAILDFADDKFTLTTRAGDYAGVTYSTLSPDAQEVFLSYPIAVGQLINATDDEVLEVFARLNSYGLPLNAPEKRHARWQGDFKWAVHNASRAWVLLWDRFAIVSVRQRLRMADDSLTAEMFGILLEGVRDGGQRNIDALYKKYDPQFTKEKEVRGRLDRVLRYFTENIANDLIGTPLLDAPHFLMLFAALAHALVGLPTGELSTLPERTKQVLGDQRKLLANLLQLASVIDADEPPREFSAFWRASKASTQRIASRRVRFPVFYRALLPASLEKE
jgi:Protein of unknown function DUF262